MTLETKLMETKLCRHCDTVKPLEAFSRDRTHADGHKARCKKCMSATRPPKNKAKAGLTSEENLRRAARANALKRLVLLHEREFLSLVKEEMNRSGVSRSKQWVQL